MEYDDEDLEAPAIVRFSDNPYCESPWLLSDRLTGLGDVTSLILGPSRDGARLQIHVVGIVPNL